jgi:peptide deformylase
MNFELIPDSDPRLHTKAVPIENVQCREVDPEHGWNWDELSQAMIVFSRENGGAGLAAPQVGVPYRLFVMGGHSLVKNRVCFNPEILDTCGSKRATEVEGCLSYPGLKVPVKRHKKIKVAYQTASGERHIRTLRNWEARVFQHELDHLNGIVLPDWVDRV